ncbi:MAG: phosphoglucosamine mutase [Micavibrio aeruginosavorus]|uniref:Phosphoglucosamine mutase n=1 Tax=Micavibrio aeruginosavorus TaxID=349221 RepID=A0A7T5R4M0_9BACT|nr:MAG: phosphoglucosamine mutase [Micavibrio aeruginosavorus]
MTRKYFGTDGIRGEANKFPMTADMALKVAMATAVALLKLNGGKSQGGMDQKRVIIGKDTRRSCYMLEQAMAAGFESMGMDVLFTGPIPTPAVSILTRTLRCDIGVMISASHNLSKDNGIKIFGSDGYKLSDAMEREIEALIDQDLSSYLPDSEKVGRATRIDDATGRYVEYIKRSVPRALTFSGMKIVVDCANGAAYKAAPSLFYELEAEVVSIGVMPNGKNINKDCGATHTEALQKAVIEHKADLGVALDGDADRLIMVDEEGSKIDGDQLLALLAVTKHKDGYMKGGSVVATVMSNLGLERYLKTQGLNLVRTQVGDRYVMEKMKAAGFNIGGEQSGHIIFDDFVATGDGLLAALQTIAVIAQSGKKASEVLNVFKPLPQILQNVRYEKGRQPLEDPGVKAAISQAEARLGQMGRVLVRASGTEPLIRVMAEGDDEKLVQDVVSGICRAVEASALPKPALQPERKPA